MTHQSARYLPSGADAGTRVAQLRHVLALVDQIAGRRRGGDAGLDEGARLSGAYDGALPIVQRRFDILAAETATWAAAGVEALLAAGANARAAAAALGEELERALDALARVLRD